MLCIENVRFWCKVEGFLDRINSPEIVIKILIDDTFAFPQLKGTTKQNTTTWEQHQIPPIELSPYQQTYKIVYALYREGALIGTGSTSFRFSEPRKDCLDIIDQESRISGKLVYELNWIKSAKAGSFITYEQFCNTKNKSAPEGGKVALVSTQIQTEKDKKYVRQEGDEDCGGFCGCFAVRKKKVKKPEVQTPPVEAKSIQRVQQQLITTKDEMSSSKRGIQPNSQPDSNKFIHKPFVYFQQQLESGKLNDLQQLNRLTYYSKTFVTSK